MKHFLFGREVSITSKIDMCGFWKTYARILIKDPYEYIGGISKEYLYDKEASISDALLNLEQEIKNTANGVMVSFYEEYLQRQRNRQNLAKEMLSNVVPKSF